MKETIYEVVNSMDPYTDLFKRIKKDLINGTSNLSTHYEISQLLSKLYGVKIIDCELSRLRHNQKLRLELIVFDEEDVSKIDIGDWRKVKISKIGELKKVYKEHVLYDDRFEELRKKLTIQENELDELFVIVSSFTDNLRWDLNINLEDQEQESFFDTYFGAKNYEVLKEFEMIVVLLKNGQTKEDFNKEAISKINKNYNTLLNEISPIAGVFEKRGIHLFIENKDDFLKTYGNLRNYLN